MVRVLAKRAFVLVLASAWGCKPAEEGRPSLLDSPRILAIQATPAEVAPEKPTTLQILRAGPSGPLDASDVSLGFCVKRKAIAAPGVVAEACLTLKPSDALVPILGAEPISAAIPKDACSLFGPKPNAGSNN